jgi:nucleoside-diphosphate kinase
MGGNITFTMIKPNATGRNLTGEILAIINKAGFKIIAMKMLKLSKEQAESFYAGHKGKSFFEDLIAFMTSGYVVAAVLQKDNAVKEFRKLIGNTNPALAAEGTIRKLYADSVRCNAVHGSDSDENAIIESDYFFSQIERIEQ